MNLVKIPQFNLSELLRKSWDPSWMLDVVLDGIHGNIFSYQSRSQFWTRPVENLQEQDNTSRPSYIQIPSLGNSTGFILLFQLIMQTVDRGLVLSKVELNLEINPNRSETTAVVTVCERYTFRCCRYRQNQSNKLEINAMIIRCVFFSSKKRTWSWYIRIDTSIQAIEL